jgi:hypothetical protein
MTVLLKRPLAATIYPGRKAKSKDWADDLDVDGVRDAKGRVRALIFVADCVRLLDRGLEVRLYRAPLPEPLDPKRSKKADSEERQNPKRELLKMRFQATIYPGANAKTKNWADDLDVDRVPDTKGRVRALIIVEDLVRLLERGLEVRLYRAHAYEPVDPALITTDKNFKSWLDERLNALKAKPGPKPFIEP